MNVLIIGSEGFIGKSCTKFFLETGNTVFGCDLLDIYNADYEYCKISRISFDFEEILQKRNYDLCINAAGNGSVPISVEHPLLDFEANTIDTFHILEGLRKYNSQCRFIYISSAAVYGNPSALPITESSIMRPISPYGWHKYYSELICQEYFALYGIQSCSIRPFSVYGPGLKKQLLWDLYRKFKTNPDKVELFGTGEETRDFIYIDDLVLSINAIVERGTFGGESYNIGSGTENSVSFVAETFKEIMAWPGEICFSGNQRVGDPINWRADITKITKCGFQQKVQLASGIKNYINWIEEKL